MSAAPAAAEPRAAPPPPPPEWHWRSFPVFFAFVCGALAVILLSAVVPLFVLFYGALFGVAFGLAHIVTRHLAARRGR